MPRKKRPEGTRAPNGASSIYFSEYDGRWHGRVTVGVKDDGSLDRRHIKRKKEVDVITAVRDLEKERDSGKVRHAGRALTLENWLTHWVENIVAPSVRPNTLSGYRVAVYNHLIPGIGAHRINKLQPEHLERFYQSLSTKTTRSGAQFKPARIHQVHRTIRTALGEAVRRGHINSNPAIIARPPRIPEEEIVPFSKTEAASVLEAAQDMRNGARFVIALTLGLRKGEALGLQWRDLNTEARTLTIRRSLQRVNWRHGCLPDNPCGRRYAGHCPKKYGGGAVAAEVKSVAGNRTMGLPAPLIRVLANHRKAQRKEREHAGNLWQDGGWMFTNLRGGPVHPRVDHDAWKALLKAAKVRDARLHDARHTAATMLLLLGVPTRAVMDVMGWSEASMTRKYQHITDELLSGIAAQVSGHYWPDSDDGDGE